MVAKNDRTVTVFGGTGFLGRRIVRYLRSCGFPVRVASRHPDRGHRLFGPDDPQLQSVEANIHDDRPVAGARAGAYGVECAVRGAFPHALFAPPAVVFGPEDAFLPTILKLLRQLPIYPMFGRGRTRLQPAYVEDVAEVVARVMRRAETHSK